MSKNFGLSETAFEQLLLQLQKGEHQLFENIFLNHFRDCMHYVINKCKAPQEDAYDVTMETLLDFRKRLIAGKIQYGNLKFLFTQMAIQKYLKWIKKEKQQPKLTETIVDPLEDDTEDLQLLEKSWGKLGDQCQDLLKGFYYQNTPLNQLAEVLQKTPAAIRKQKQRCVDRLRQLFLQYSNQ